MFRKYLKPSVYLAFLIIPFLVLVFKPKGLSAVLILDAAVAPVSWVQGFVFEFKKIFYYQDTYNEYRRIKKQVDLLKARVVKLQDSAQAASRFENISLYRRAQPFITSLAVVIGRDPSSWDASLILDKGSADGIKVGMPVVSPLGVVGKIFEVGHSTSKAALLADPNFSVAVVVARSRESGLLTGTLQGLCRLQYLTTDADVKVGDVVVTSQLSSSFPQGLLIGVIVDVQASVNSHTVECLVKPAVDLSQIEEVIIIKNGRH